MLSHLTKAGILAAVAGASMQVLATAPAEAFTLSAPSPAPTVANADIDHVWYDRWGRWHPNRRYWGYGYYPHRHWHCWYGPYGRRCHW